MDVANDYVFIFVFKYLAGAEGTVKENILATTN